MTQQEFNKIVAESNEQAKKNYNCAILTQTKNVWKVIFKAKSNSANTLEIYTTATSCEKAVKKVLDTLYQDKNKYAHIFYHYAVYPYGFVQSEDFRRLTKEQRLFWSEKHPTALLVTGVDTLFVA